MFVKLTGDAGRVYWINTDHILSMEIVDVEKGFASNRIIFHNSGSEMVHESPHDIATLANGHR